MHQRIIVVLAGFLVMGMASAHADGKGESLHWSYKIGGEERFRYEYKENFDFNDSKKDNGSPLFNRSRVNLKLSLTDTYLNPVMDVFAEGLDAEAGAYRIKATPQQDRFDFHQGYVHFYNLLGSPVDIKVGRQELSYGKGRLIAAPTWANLRAFDAAVTHIHWSQGYADFFYGQVVKDFAADLDRSSDEEEFGGVYAGYQKNAVSPLVESYFLTQVVSSGPQTTKRYTAGARLKLPLPQETVLDIEVPYQFGETGKTFIRAYAFHADISKGFSSVPWAPELAVSYDEASGDKNSQDTHSNTFVPLYQSTHDPYGLMDFFRWENVRNPEVSVTFSPTKKFRFKSQADFFWLQDKNDAWYNSSGTRLRSPLTAPESPYVGSEVSLRFFYDFTKNIKFESGYAHFFSGAYVAETGANDDSDWIYSQLSLKY